MSDETEQRLCTEIRLREDRIHSLEAQVESNEEVIAQMAADNVKMAKELEEAKKEIEELKAAGNEPI